VGWEENGARISSDMVNEWLTGGGVIHVKQDAMPQADSIVSHPFHVKHVENSMAFDRPRSLG
jgi:hypothetical protein